MNSLRVHPLALCVSADKPKDLTKAAELGVKFIIIDLEDGVALENKLQARKNLVDYLAKPSENILTFVRINPINTKFGMEDILALSEKNLHYSGIVAPKIESPDIVNVVLELLSPFAKDLSIAAVIETANGLSHVTDIVSKSHCLSALMFGTSDFAVDVGCAIDSTLMSQARGRVAQGAAIKNLAVYDSPYFNVEDEAGLIRETMALKALGFTGKIAIHPAQINPIKNVFRPTEEEYERAKAILERVRHAQGIPCQYQGKLIDAFKRDKALQLVQLYENC